MAAVQSALLFAPPAALGLHPHGPFPPQQPPAAAIAAPAPHDHSDGEEEEEDDDDDDMQQLHWWLQGHGPAPAPPPPLPPAHHQHQHQHRHRHRHRQRRANHNNGPRGPQAANGAAAAMDVRGAAGGRGGGGEDGGPSGDGPLAFLFRQLVVHPVQALVRGLSGSKKKGQGHRHRHHAHHAPTATAPPSAALETEEEEDDVVEDEHEEEEEPAPVLLVGVPRVYSCGECRTHLASDMDVISRAFQGRGGRAFLLDAVVNTVTGPPEDRLLMTGVHTVADLHCLSCRALLGWKYEKAHEPSQRYKEGKFILERVRLFHEAEDGEGGAHNEGWLSL